MIVVSGTVVVVGVVVLRMTVLPGCSTWCRVGPGWSAAGQVVAVRGGPRAMSKMVCQASFQGHAVGRWMVMRLAEVAMRAGTFTM